MGKQVKTPRFYVDLLTYQHAVGDYGLDSTDKGGAELMYMNCSNPFIQTVQSDDTEIMFEIGQGLEDKGAYLTYNFCGLLNHNFGVMGDYTTHTFDVQVGKNLTFEMATSDSLFEFNTKNIVNMYDSLQYPYYNGWSLFTFDDYRRYIDTCQVKIGLPDNTNYVDKNFQLGSIVLGKYIDCPNSPDMNITMSRRFDGIKQQKTIGGKTLSNIYYSGPTDWTMNSLTGKVNKIPPFEFIKHYESTESNNHKFSPKENYGRKGLRSWKLTFSYVSENDMWIDKEYSNYYISDTETDTHYNPSTNSNSFNFVWNYTLGGTLPFLFTDDKDTTRLDRYSICNFRENTLSVQQIAFNTYKVSVTIDEIA